MRVIKARWEPVRPPFNGIMHGEKTYRGTLKLLVDKIPKPECRWIGNFIYGEKGGYVLCYERIVGTIDGFAGHPITIQFEGGAKVVFKGDLWDPYHVPDNIPKHMHVSITTEPKVMDIGYTFYAGKITKELFYKLFQEQREILFRKFYI